VLSDVVDAGEMFCKGAVGGGFEEGEGAPLTIWSRRISDMLVMACSLVWLRLEQRSRSSGSDCW
jgi:hypothetical protein